MIKSNEFPPKNLNKKPEDVKVGDFSWIKSGKIAKGASKEAYLKKKKTEANQNFVENIENNDELKKSEKSEDDKKKIEKNQSENIKNNSSKKEEEDMENGKESGGMIKNFLKETFLKVSGLKAINAWKDYKEEKKGNVEEKKEIKEEELEKINLEQFAKKSLDNLKEKYFMNVSAKGDTLNFFSEISKEFNKKNENLEATEVRKKWNERIRKVEEKLQKREERRRKAKEEVIDRYNQLEIKEKKKKVEAITETIYTAGLHASWFTGVAAFVGLGARLAAPALKSIEHARLDGKLNLDGVKEGIFKTFKALNPRSKMDRNERIDYLSGTVRTAFSTWAMSNGYSNFFSEGELAGENFKTGFGAIQDSVKESGENKDSWLNKVKGFFGGTSSEQDSNQVIENKNIADSSKVDNMEGANFSETVIGKVDDNLSTEIVTETVKEFSKIENYEIKVPKGAGAIKTFELLREKVLEDYSSISKSEQPEMVKNFLSMDAEELAKKYGFYDSNSTQDSAMLHYGDSFKFSENGLEYIKSGGNIVLLEDGVNFTDIEGSFGDKGGEMFEVNKQEIDKLHLEVVESTLEEILNKTGEVDINSVVNQGEELVKNGWLTMKEGEKISYAFLNNLSEENQNLLRNGESNLEISMDEFRNIIKDAFNIEILDKDIMKNNSNEFDISSESFNRIMNIYADSNQELTEEKVLSEIFNKENNLNLTDLAAEDIMTEKEIFYEKSGYEIYKTGNTFLVAGDAIEDMYKEAGLTRLEIDKMIEGVANQEYTDKKSIEFLKIFNKFLFTEEEGGLESAKKFVNELIRKRAMKIVNSESSDEWFKSDVS